MIATVADGVSCHQAAFAKLKAPLRKTAARTLDQFQRVIGDSLDAFSPGECANSFTAAGYDAYQSGSALADETLPSTDFRPMVSRTGRPANFVRTEDVKKTFNLRC